jgi:hypothetical protein
VSDGPQTANLKFHAPVPERLAVHISVDLEQVRNNTFRPHFVWNGRGTSLANSSPGLRKHFRPSPIGRESRLCTYLCTTMGKRRLGCTPLGRSLGARAGQARDAGGGLMKKYVPKPRAKLRVGRNSKGELGVKQAMPGEVLREGKPRAPVVGDWHVLRDSTGLPPPENAHARSGETTGVQSRIDGDGIGYVVRPRPVWQVARADRKPPRLRPPYLLPTLMRVDRYE